MRNYFFILLVLSFYSCSTLVKNQTMENSPEVKVTVTYSNKSQLLKDRESIYFYEDFEVDNKTITIDDSVEFQTMKGFGAGLTQTSAYLIYNHPDRSAIVKDLFSKDGLSLNFLRLPLGASDFALEWFTYDDVPGDVDLEFFSLEQDLKYTIPLLKEILDVNPGLQLVASPWSAPGWMKKGNVHGEKNLSGGFLNPDYYEIYADYLVKTLVEYKKNGIDIQLLTLQNEPLFYSASYPCMYMDSDHQRELIKVLAPKLDEAELYTKILLYDHNWDRPDYPRDVMDFLEPEYDKYIQGAAFHGYGGSPEGQSLFKKDYMDKEVYFTEITGGGWSPAFASNLRWNYQNIFIGSIRNWSSAVMLWNLALDEKGGPNIRPEAKSKSDIMRGVITIDSKNGDVNREVEYYALGQMSKFVKPGAKRISSTNCDGDVISAAFKNPDGEIVLVILNGSWLKNASFKVNINGKSFNYSLPVESVVTFRWIE